MPLKLEKNKVREDNHSLRSKTGKNASKKIITMILFLMASLLTFCSLYMVGVTAFQRSSTDSEAIIIAGVSICVAFSAHLLPALVKGRQSKKVYLLISFIWIVCVSATLYSHTLFFVTTQNEHADVRADNSPEIKGIQNLIDQKQKWISEQKSRSLNDINVSIANETIRIDQLTPRNCAACKTIQSRINSYQARKEAFESEKAIAQNIEDEKNKVLQMQEQLMSKKDGKRTDAVFEKISQIFPGVSYAAFNLISSIVNALLLEILATLFWWLLSPNKKSKDDNLGDNQEMVLPEIINVPYDNSEKLKLIDENMDTNINNIQKNQLINFKRNISEKFKNETPYVVYENEIYDVRVEDLFQSIMVISISAKKINETERLISYNKDQKIKSEDFYILNYVKNVSKKQINNETFFNDRYVYSIKKNIIRNTPTNNENNIPRINDRFFEENSPLIIEDNTQKIENKGFDFSFLNTEDLNDGTVKISLDPVIEKTSINKESFSEKKPFDYTIVGMKNNFVEKRIEPFYFDYKKSLSSIKDKENITVENNDYNTKSLKNKNRSYLDKFLAIPQKNESNEKEELKKKAKTTIMDEVFKAKGLKKSEDEDVIDRSLLIDDEQISFMEDLNSIADTLQE